MNLLAIETATDACSVALSIGAELRERHRIAPRQHAALVLDMVCELLSEAGIELASLDAIAFGRGPGSFTGVRIAAGVTQGLAFGADLPVAPVSTLHICAIGAGRAHRCDRVLVALDARMGEVYWGAFGREESVLMQPTGDELVCLPDAVPVPAGGGWLGVGPGWEAHRTVLCRRLNRCVAGLQPAWLPRASDMIELADEARSEGRLISPEQAVPVYLRDRVATPRAS